MDNHIQGGALLSIRSKRIVKGSIITVTAPNKNTDCTEVKVQAAFQSRGTLLNVLALGLVSGSAVKITTGNKAIELVTKSSFLSSGAFQLRSDSLEYGKAWKISSDDFHRGSLLEIKTKSVAMDESSNMLKLQVNQAKTGTMIDIHGAKLVDGIVLSTSLEQLSTGMSFAIEDTPFLSNGKLLNIQTISSQSVNPILFRLNNIDDGTGVYFRSTHLTTGTVLDLSTKTGNKMVYASNTASKGGKVFVIDGQNEAKGTLLNVRGYSLVKGSAVKITGFGKSIQSNGHLMEIVSNASIPTNGVVNVGADSVVKGTIMHVSLDETENGRGVHLSTSTGSSMNKYGVLLKIDGDSQKRGTLLDVLALGLVSGSAVKITTGNKAIDLVTKSSFLSSGAVVVEALDVENGCGLCVSMENMKDGVGLQIGSTDAFSLNESGTLLKVSGESQTNGHIFHY